MAVSNQKQPERQRRSLSALWTTCNFAVQTSKTTFNKLTNAAFTCSQMFDSVQREPATNNTNISDTLGSLSVEIGKRKSHKYKKTKQTKTIVYHLLELTIFTAFISMLYSKLKHSLHNFMYSKPFRDAP